MREQLKERGVVRGHHQVPSVSENDRRRQLSVGVHCTVDTVTYSHEIRGYTHCHILTFINRASLINGCNHNSAVVAITDLHKLDISVDVNVRVLASLDPHILICKSGLLDGNTLIEAVHVYNLPFGLMWSYYLCKPVDYYIHINFDGVTPRLVERCQCGQLHTRPLQAACLLHLEEDAEGVELGGAEGGLRAVDVRGDQPQQQLQVRFHEVQDDLVLRLRVVDLRILRTRARTLRGKRVLDTPGVLRQVVTLLCREL